MGAQETSTLQTIADKLGLSRNTVSLALRGSPRISEATRKSILKAATKLDYRPNLVARAMATGRSNVLGVLIPCLNWSTLPVLLQAIHDEAYRAKYSLLTMTHNNDAGVFAGQLDHLFRRRVDGAIILPPVPRAQPATWDILRKSGLRAAFLDYAPRGCGPLFRMDEAQAGRLAAEKLVACGHRRLARVGPGNKDHYARQHTAGVRDAARKARMPTPENYVFADSVEGGVAAGKYFLTLKKRPTGLVCFSDRIAAGLLQFLAANGVAIPEEVSVTGVDDGHLAEAAAVPITTLHAPDAEIGRAAARHLLCHEEHPAQTVFPWKWIERKSVGYAPKT